MYSFGPSLARSHPLAPTAQGFWPEPSKTFSAQRCGLPAYSSMPTGSSQHSFKYSLNARARRRMNFYPLRGRPIATCNPPKSQDDFFKTRPLNRRHRVEDTACWPPNSSSSENSKAADTSRVASTYPGGVPRGARWACQRLTLGWAARSRCRCRVINGLTYEHGSPQRLVIIILAFRAVRPLQPATNLWRQHE